MIDIGKAVKGRRRLHVKTMIKVTPQEALIRSQSVCQQGDDREREMQEQSKLALRILMRNQPRQNAQTTAPISPIKREIEEGIRFKSLLEGDADGIGMHSNPR
jgi:hypothetical protein